MNSLDHLRKLLREGRRCTDMDNPNYDPNGDDYKKVRHSWTRLVRQHLADVGGLENFEAKQRLVEDMPLQNQDGRPEKDWKWRKECHALEWTLMDLC